VVEYRVPIDVLCELHMDICRYKKNDFIVVVTKENDDILLPFAHSVKF